MIRGENHDGVVKLTRCLKGCNDLANRIVYHGDHAGSQGACLKQFALAGHKACLLSDIP